MIFNTYWFICFSAVFFPVYWLLFRPVWRKPWLLAGCAVFHYHFAGPAGVIPIIVIGVATYLVALTRRRFLCAAGIVLCVAALCFYKYALFFCADLLGAFNPGAAAALEKQVRTVLPGAAPLGISFFAFEFVHYLVEVWRGQEPIRRPGDFVLFAIHFPSLVAGPIKRYPVYVPGLQAGLAGVTVDDVAAGAQRIALGLVKKIVLADNLTLAISFYGDGFAGLSTGQAWLFLAALSARILLDFSGYTDMALGLSRLLGVRLPENFNYPYAATSLQDFWQRWHMSLTSWIRDYVYIPLGGNRHGRLRQLVNGLIVFALCGLWHGPAWHFVLWGLWHGVGLMINFSYATILGSVGRGLAGVFARLPALGWVVTLLYVAFGWLLFFYEPLRAWTMAAKLFALHWP
ncbi:MAG: MBOAT family protein [Lacunisphaera sp.]|nr:MBOAT family protein [Lacunisphaera sp.]